MNLIPTPQHLTLSDGAFSLQQAPVLVKADSDPRIVRAAEQFRRELAAQCGCFVRFAVCAAPTPASVSVSHGPAKSEEYTLTVDQNGVRIEAPGAAGAFYGIQTLRQLLVEYGGTLPFVRIEDAPGFAVRGVYHDVSRGRVPTLASLKKLADRLAFWKQNELQLYMEDAFWNEEYASFRDREACLTAEELLELDAYCAERFIDLVPSLSTFGHLYNLLQSERYRSLCEYENWQPKRHYWVEKMEHHTLDVFQPESFALVRRMIEEYLPLFRSAYFNICCDETFDLCKGRNAGKDAGEAYYTFVRQIIELVQSYGKKVQMWGDIVLHHTEKLDRIPKDVRMLNWNYNREPPRSWVETFANQQLEQVVCTGTSAWDHWAADLDTATQNIRKFTGYGRELGAVGTLTTNWGDYGAIASVEAALYPLGFGAQEAWNPGQSTQSAFDRAADCQIFGLPGTSEKLWALTEAEKAAPWYQLVWWVSAKTIEQREMELPLSEKTADAVRIAAALAAEWRAEAQRQPLFLPLSLAAEGVSLTARTFLWLHGQEDAALAGDWEDFLARYGDAWLADNKPSELWRIKDFVRQVLSLR